MAKAGIGVVGMKVMAGGIRSVRPGDPMYPKLTQPGALFGEGETARPIPSAASSLGLIAGQAPDQVAGDPWAGQDISRNAPCPCGSGQKYKHCHGVAA